jgi:vacuolar protein sorting-associated protein 26
LRYFLRVFINKKYNAVKEEFEFGVLLPSTEEDVDQINPLKMEVGIEDCLHIEFQYNKGKYYLKDCVTGRVNFALVKINLKYM